MQPPWIAEQLTVIQAPAVSRIVVEAPPGTGKTAVACARVALLLERDDLPPSSILMISFTRTAVAEMKARVAKAVTIPGVASLNVATLDQTAFSFGVGCGEKFEELMGSFDGNMARAADQLATGNPLLLEYLSRLRHVVIDEAQDLTGIRADFTAAVIARISPEAGVSVFADRLQAIYGFTSDVEDEGLAKKNFAESYDFAKFGFQCMKLETLHRTNDARLVKLFQDARAAVTAGSAPALRPEAVLKAVRAAGPDLGAEIQKLGCVDGDLVLFRKRSSALMAAQWCPTVYRMRLPAYPSVVLPWVSAVFSLWTEPTITAAEFGTRFGAIPKVLRGHLEPSEAWKLLLRFSQDRRGNIDVGLLRTLVSRTRPPVELCYTDCGGHGPIFSTIHASKGREADRVFLMLPRDLDYLDSTGEFKVNPDEEARVFYVGATRGRKDIMRGTATTMVGAGRLDRSGKRVVQILSLRKMPKFQFGIDGDLDERTIIGRDETFCASDAAAAKAQHDLVVLWQRSIEQKENVEATGTLSKMKTLDGAEDKYVFSVGKQCIAWSGLGLIRDLRATGRKMQDKLKCGRLDLPEKLPSLRLIGLRSCAIPASPEHEGFLREPYATSGFYLAPIITGFPSVFFRFAQS